MRGLKSRLLGALALCLLTVSAGFVETGCSQKTGINAAQEIVNWTPPLTNAVSTISATLQMLDPAAAPVFAAATAGFDAAAQLVVQYAKAYLANPSASVLANLQTAITTLEQSVDAALLKAVRISDPRSQQLAIAAINGIGTIATTILALVQSISSKAELRQMADRSTIKLAQVRPLMDTQRMASIGAQYGVGVDHFFAAEAQAGF